MRERMVQGRAWDSFDAYLFDIDGTLIHCKDAVHYFAFCESLTAVSGRPVNLDGVITQGNVDVGILRDAFALAGVAQEEWRPRLPEIREAMGRYVESHKHELCADRLPYVVQTLEHLRGQGATLGIATGNLREIGRLKLQNAKVLDYFSVGGWSDSFETRAEVFAAALAQMREAAGKEASICVVGDTPADVLAAHANGLPVIAVATGVHSLAELMPHAPELCLSSLAELFEG